MEMHPEVRQKSSTARRPNPGENGDSPLLTANGGPRVAETMSLCSVLACHLTATVTTEMGSTVVSWEQRGQWKARYAQLVNTLPG